MVSVFLLSILHCGLFVLSGLISMNNAFMEG